MIFEGLKFFTEEYDDKEELKNLIESNGGTLSDRKFKESIVLVKSGENFKITEKKSPLYSLKFVYDCISRQKLLKLHDYSFKDEKTKVPYTPEEDLSMKEFVSKNIGNPDNLSY